MNEKIDLNVTQSPFDYIERLIQAEQWDLLKDYLDQFKGSKAALLLLGANRPSTFSHDKMLELWFPAYGEETTP